MQINNPSFGSANSGSTPEIPCDQMDREQARKRAEEAAERATFHRIEAERWERIGRAAVAAAEILEATMPVEQSTAAQWASPEKNSVAYG